jgi:hypothetical protein
MLTVFKVKSKVFEYPGIGAWHFISVPKKESQTIKATFAGMKRGFGSLRVIATVGKTKWKTSIFPDSESGTYFLPLKSEVRKKEKVKKGDEIEFTIEILL